MEPGQPVVQTLARFGEGTWCKSLTADRAGNIYAAVSESHLGKPTYVLQLMPGSNELVQLPLRLDEHGYRMAVSPSGQELYEGTYDGRILVHRAPWTADAEEVLHGACDLKYCDDNRYVLLLAHSLNVNLP